MPIGGNGYQYNTYNLINNLSFGSGCRCCYDPNGDGGDYELLAEARRERGDDYGVGGNGYLNGTVDNLAGDAKQQQYSDEDSDDGEFDYLLDEDIPGTTTSVYDEQRRAELENTARHYEVARYHGYGVHRQMHPQRVFAAVGYGADQVRDAVCPRGSVLHLYDAYSPLSVSLDLCLEEMATRFAGTKFVRGIGITSILYADERSGNSTEWKKGDLPMLLAIREGRVVAYSSGLRDFHRGGNSETVESKAVEQWLDHAGVLLSTPPHLDSLCRIRPEEEMLLLNMRKLNESGSGGGGGFGGMMGHMKGLEDLEEEKYDRYDCGVASCNKSFHHEHVGVKNEAQDGLLVSESQVVAASD